MSSNKAAIYERLEWQFLVQEKDPSRTTALYQKLAAGLERADVDYLEKLLESGTEDERLRAMRVLLAAVRSGSQAFEHGSRQRLSSMLAHMSSSYPKELGLTAFYLLRSIDTDNAEKALLAVKPGNLDEAALFTYISNLSLFPVSSAAMEMLRHLSSRDDTVGRRAQLQLDNLGLMGEARVRDFAEQWRLTKSRDALNKLYYGFISHQGGKPIGPIIKTLGPPSRQVGSRYFYESSDGVTLYLEVDNTGNLKAMNVK